MKSFFSVLFLVCVLLPTVFVKQSAAYSDSRTEHNKVQVGANTTSWLFVLEDGAQWTLVLQSHLKEGVRSSSASVVTSVKEVEPSSSWLKESTEEDSMSRANREVTSKRSSLNATKQALRRTKKSEDGSSNQLIFEGNIDDVPFVERPGQHQKKAPLDPSAPGS